MLPYSWYAQTMKISIRLDDELLQRAKKKALKEGRTLDSLIEEGLAIVLAERRDDPGRRIELPVSSASGGLQPGVDLNRSSDLEDVMENS